MNRGRDRVEPLNVFIFFAFYRDCVWNNVDGDDAVGRD